MRKGGIAMATAAAVLVSAPPAGAQSGSHWIDYVRETLDGLSRQLQRQSYATTLLLEQGYLEPAETASFTVTMAEDTVGSARVLATCDRDCDDVDVWVHDANGQLVAQDIATDATPQLSFQAQAGARYSVTVRMYDCSTPICFYALAVIR